MSLPRTRDLVRQVRDHVRAQADDWQRVPLLALLADGRSGYSNTYAMAYRRGLWLLEASVAHGGYRAAIDCASGEILNPATGKKAFDEVIIALLTAPDELDAAAVIADLEAAACAPIAGGYPRHHELKLAADAAKLRAELGLGERYTR